MKTLKIFPFYLLLIIASVANAEQNSKGHGAMRQEFGHIADPRIGTHILPEDGVYEYNDHAYTFHYQTRVTWEEARDICASESKGSYLAVIEDMDEAEFVAEAMAGSNLFVSLQNVWIGGHYVTDRWIWNATGDVIPGKPGMDGYPPWGPFAVTRGRDCLLLDRYLWNMPKFQELQCNRRRLFLCERGCTRLSDNDRGHWEPASCAEQAGEMGDKCKFVCNTEYQHSGSDVIECTGVGWNGTGGFGNLPKCRTPEELGDDLVDKINDTLSNAKKAGLLFLLDESGSVSQAHFQTELTFIKALVAAFPTRSTVQPVRCQTNPNHQPPS